MKCYLQIDSIRLTGKGWEIRHYLKGITASAPIEMTLADWLDRRPIKESPKHQPPVKNALADYPAPIPAPSAPLQLLG